MGSYLLDLFKSAFGRIDEAWPGLFLGYFAGLHITLDMPLVGHYIIVQYLLKYLGLGVAAITGALGAAIGRDIYKSFGQPLVIRMRICFKFKNKKNDRQDAA